MWDSRRYPDENDSHRMNSAQRDEGRILSVGAFCRVALWLLLASAFLSGTPVAAQVSFEVAPLVGYQFGGSFRFQPEGQPQPLQTNLGNASSVGVAAGVLFDEYSLIEFHWTHSKTPLEGSGLGGQPADLPERVNLDRFHADFTREFPLEEAYWVRPFLTAGVGVNRVAGGGSSFTRFSFGLGTGLNIRLHSHLGLRIQAQWLPIWVNPKVKAFACAGGCVVVLGGTFTHHGEVSFGPVFRF